jgi:hypothetical protein
VFHEEAVRYTDTHSQNFKKAGKLETKCTHNEPSQNSNNVSNTSTKKEKSLGRPLK